MFSCTTQFIFKGLFRMACILHLPCRKTLKSLSLLLLLYFLLYFTDGPQDFNAPQNYKIHLKKYIILTLKFNNMIKLSKLLSFRGKNQIIYSYNLLQITAVLKKMSDY